MEKSKKSVTKPVSPITVGKNVLIRTVTFTQIGHVVSVTKREILLSNASWVADTGRFSTALSTGKWASNAEIEKVPGLVSVSRGAIVDAYEWTHDLPMETV